MKLSDLEKIGVLGSGAFGQVMLVKYEGNYMALKTLSKQQILEMGLQVSCRGSSGPMALRSPCLELEGCTFPTCSIELASAASAP